VFIQVLISNSVNHIIIVVILIVCLQSIDFLFWNNPCNHQILFIFESWMFVPSQKFYHSQLPWLIFFSLVLFFSFHILNNLSLFLLDKPFVVWKSLLKFFRCFMSLCFFQVCILSGCELSLSTCCVRSRSSTAGRALYIRFTTVVVAPVDIFRFNSVLHKCGGQRTCVLFIFPFSVYIMLRNSCF